jgi:hypothetical protein
MKKTTNELEDQLRDAIARCGKSLNQLGQAANVNDAQLSRFMRGERTLTLETAGRLCSILGLRFCESESPSLAPVAVKRPRGRPRLTASPAGPAQAGKTRKG